MADIFKINGEEYECEFKLSNPDNQETKFTKSAILAMEIVDSVFDPFVSGTISISNPYDFVEREYAIRGDGRDKFKIKFKPKESKFVVDYTFVLIDESNVVNPEVRSENVKIFSLIDENAIPFMEQIPYGTAFSGKVGKIIQEIFIELLGEEKVDKNKWEEGDFELFYIPPLTFRYIDVLKYLLKLFYAKDGDIHVKGLITYNVKNENYSFRLISKVFEKHKDNLLEAFIVGDLTSNVKTDNKNNPPPDGKVFEYTGNLHNIGYSTPMYNWNNNFYVNSLVIGYDRILGVDKIRKIKFEDLRDKWKTKFVEVFKSIGGKPKPFTIKNKSTDKKFKIYKLPYAVEDSIKIVEAEMNNQFIYVNLSCSLTNIGSTERRSSKFIDVVSTKGDQELKSDQKLLGRWFVTEVRHIFKGDTYVNKLFCTKTYAGPEANFKEDTD
jgi:hypothetical protein